MRLVRTHARDVITCYLMAIHTWVLRNILRDVIFVQYTFSFFPGTCLIQKILSALLFERHFSSTVWSARQLNYETIYNILTRGILFTWYPIPRKGKSLSCFLKLFNGSYFFNPFRKRAHKCTNAIEVLI